MSVAMTFCAHLFAAITAWTPVPVQISRTVFNPLGIFLAIIIDECENGESTGKTFL
jgi:hypothetical protein